MNRNRIIAVITAALALIGLAAVPAIQATSPSAAFPPVNFAPPHAAAFSGPLSTWSAYQPIDGAAALDRSE